MEYTIRPALETDLQALLDLYLPYHRELETYGMNYTLNEEQLPDVLLAKIKSRLILAAVAQGANGALLGFVFCSISRLSREYACQGVNVVGYLQDLCVAPAARRQGVATGLVDYAKHWLLDNGVMALELQVLCGNPGGLAFWKRCGLSPLGTLCYQNLNS